MVSRKNSLFGRMQRGRSPSFELFQLDMYEIYIDYLECTNVPAQKTRNLAVQKSSCYKLVHVNFTREYTLWMELYVSCLCFDF